MTSFYGMELLSFSIAYFGRQKKGPGPVCEEKRTNHDACPFVVYNRGRT